MSLETFSSKIRSIDSLVANAIQRKKPCVHLFVNRAWFYWSVWKPSYFKFGWREHEHRTKAIDSTGKSIQKTLLAESLANVKNIGQNSFGWRYAKAWMTNVFNMLLYAALVTLQSKVSHENRKKTDKVFCAICFVLARLEPAQKNVCLYRTNEWFQTYFSKACVKYYLINGY